MRTVLLRRLCVLVVLICQLGLPAILPITLCQMSALAAAPEVCTCGHEPGAECPMHKGASQSGEASSESRLCAGCGDEATVIVNTSSGTFGILAAGALENSPLAARTAPSAHSESVLSLVSPPNSPPPRG